MGDAEAVLEGGAGAVQRVVSDVGVDRDQVRGGDVHAGGELPDVQVVDVLYAWDGRELVGDLVRVDPRRRVLAQDGQDLSPEHDGADDDEDGDRQRHDGVPPRLSSPRDQRAGGDHTDRAEGVGHDLEVGALDVQALLGPGA